MKDVPDGTGAKPQQWAASNARAEAYRAAADNLTTWRHLFHQAQAAVQAAPPDSPELLEALETLRWLAGAWRTAMEMREPGSTQ